MIDPQDVVIAYRLILDREPRSDELVNRYATEIADLNALRDLFLGSSDFRYQFEQFHALKRFKKGFNGPTMKLELAQLAKLWAKTAAQWHHLGEAEPYWSAILTMIPKIKKRL